jgi:hypothetical protein
MCIHTLYIYLRCNRWCGLPASPTELKKRHDVDDVQYADSLSAFFTQLLDRPRVTVHTLPESPPLPAALDGRNATHDKSALSKALHEARSCKTEAEIAIMKSVPIGTHFLPTESLGRADLAALSVFPLGKPTISRHVLTKPS